MVYRLNETRDEPHIHILGGKKNCSMKRYFWVPTTFLLVAAFKCVAKILAL